MTFLLDCGEPDCAAIGDKVGGGSACGRGAAACQALWLSLPVAGAAAYMAVQCQRQQAAEHLLQTPDPHCPHPASPATQCRSALAGRGFELPLVRGKKAAAPRRRWLCFGKRSVSGSGKAGAQEVGQPPEGLPTCSRGLQAAPLSLASLLFGCMP